MIDDDTQKEITVTFLNVGQADSVVITLPDRKSAVVVDCAKNGSETVGYLEKAGITGLVRIILTHTDNDHMGGALGLVQNFDLTTKELAYNIDTLKIREQQGKLTTLRHLLQLSEEKGIETSSPKYPDFWEDQDVKINILHPDDHFLKNSVLNEDPNNGSLLLMVSFGNNKLLLSSDIEGKGWESILERGVNIKADVLKFPHHGAWYTPVDNEPSLKDLIKHNIDPSLVVISVGTQNPYNHPRAETLSFLHSYPGLRFVCTQATKKCHSPLETSKEPCKCAGTVDVKVKQNYISVHPTRENHEKIISQFNQPQCVD